MAAIVVPLPSSRNLETRREVTASEFDALNQERQNAEVAKGVADLGIVIVDTLTGGPARRASEERAAAEAAARARLAEATKTRNMLLGLAAAVVVVVVVIKRKRR